MEEKKQQKHNIILTIIITLVTILVGIVVGFGINEFFDIDNYIDEYEENYEEDINDLVDDVVDELEDNVVDDESNKNENSVINNDTSMLINANIENCEIENCSEIIKNIKITYNIGEEFGEGTIKINDKVVLEEIIWLEDVLVLDEVIIIVTTGTDIRSTIIDIFDKNGNNIKSIYGLDDKYDDMVISSYEITEDGINISGDRMTHGPAFAYDNEVLDECVELKEREKEVTSGEYIINYLGNGKFSELSKKREYTLKEDMKTYIEDICKSEN